MTDLQVLLITGVLYFIAIYLSIVLRQRFIFLSTIVLWFVPIFLITNSFIIIFSIIMIIFTIVIVAYNGSDEGSFYE